MQRYIAIQIKRMKDSIGVLGRAITSAAALDEYLGATVMFVVIGVTVSVGAYITSQIQSQIGNATYTCVASSSPCNFLSGNTANILYGTAYNAAGNAVTGFGTFAQWLPILAIVLVAVVIIALLYSFFRGGGGTSREAPVDTGDLAA